MSKSITVPAGRDPLTISINNRTFTYRAGDTVTVPDEVATLLENVARLLPKEDPDAHNALWAADIAAAIAASGGGGADALLVAGTCTDGLASIDSDLKTVYDAFAAGRTVYLDLKFSESITYRLQLSRIYPKSGDDPANAYFAKFDRLELIDEPALFLTCEFDTDQTGTVTWTATGRSYHAPFVITEDDGGLTATTTAEFSAARQAFSNGSEIAADCAFGSTVFLLPLRYHDVSSSGKPSLLGFAGVFDVASVGETPQPMLMQLEWRSGGITVSGVPLAVST